MYDFDKMKIVCDSIDMYESLHHSIQHAGGSGASFTNEKLQIMTVTKLIAELALNGVRFYNQNTHKLKRIGE